MHVHPREHTCTHTHTSVYHWCLAQIHPPVMLLWTLGRQHHTTSVNLFWKRLGNRSIQLLLQRDSKSRLDSIISPAVAHAWNFSVLIFTTSVGKFSKNEIGWQTSRRHLSQSHALLTPLHLFLCISHSWRRNASPECSCSVYHIQKRVLYTGQHAHNWHSSVINMEAQ